MTIVATDPQRFQMLEESLALFWPDPPEDLWVVVSWADPSQGFCSQWVRAGDLDQALCLLDEKAQQYNAYVGMGLRQAACHPVGRGTSADVGAIGGLWVECDHTGGVHTSRQLPTPFQLMKFLESLPFEFSLLIDSTGGFHGHLLFKELWILDSPDEQAAAALLLRRLQRTIQIAALTRGWHVDTTADLARVLRPAGTFNHKSGTPQLVTIAEATQVRYNPSDLADAPWLAEVMDTYTPSPGSDDFADAHLDRMVPGCAWLAHCRDDAATLSEPEWYAMLGIVGRCVDGDQHVHTWSAPYPHYDQKDTSTKLQHALKAAGPRACDYIRYELGGESYCQACPHWKQVTSPITLAMDDGVRLAKGALVYAKPPLKITPDIYGMVNQAEAAILALPGGPHLYQRIRHLVTIATDAPMPKWLSRPPDMPIIVEARAPMVRELLTQAALWARFDKRSNRWEETMPPALIAETLLARSMFAFPALEGLVCSPTLRPDGSILDQPGYDESTGLYLHFNGVTFPSIPDHPGLQQARDALEALTEPLVDFLFAADCHRSAALAAILSLVCRVAIQGYVPLFAIRANTRGSGKSLLADVISLIGTGRPAPHWPQVTEEEEERKRVLTIAMAGYPVVHIDNVTQPLGSPALDAALTSPTFPDRLLGKNESREVPLTLVWLASGNNMEFRGDMARRVMPIDLDVKMERPEERTGFKHAPLLAWVRQERPRLAVAALTLVKAYCEAQRPAQGVTPFGSFEPWSDLIRQSLVWVGEPDPCEGRIGLEAKSDPDHERLAVLLEAWDQCYPKREGCTLGRVMDDIRLYAAVPPHLPNTWDTLRDALGAFDRKYTGKDLSTTVVGNAFRRFQRKIIAGKRFKEHEPKVHNKTVWVVEAV